ncbi:hypothetical protein AVEN_52847-1 [Araneus ventricosus]|uniref:Endonuclease/exonuclease/phosphatase domain-containing protein n=1 Tax=Araneus ventricosus TaxID=182803 RepID=A0A4Y2KRM7_ARAVE|nr:hypothetical protein AVEN_52847-1 [Araneus ventricosus]
MESNKKINDLRIFVNKYLPDIILIQETLLRPNRKIFLANYASYYSYRNNPDRTHTGGGTAILIKNNIPHYELTPPTLHYVEASIVVLNFKDKDPITITSIYIPPTTDTSLFTIDLESLIKTSPNQIICGDFNAKHTSWGCLNDCTRGKNLKHFSDLVGLEILAPTTPTRYGNNSASTIDLALVKDFLYPYEIHSIPELSSDHNPVILNFYFKYTLPRSQSIIKTNWKKFTDNLTNSNNLNFIEINTPE